jgi:single-strand DNA-binding protein
MNSVNMIGRLTRDPELRTTNTGKDVASFSIAVAKRFKREGEPDADFFRCTTWSQSATYISNYGFKGARVSVTGRLETRKFTDREGNERENVEIVVDNVSVLDRAEDTRGNSGAGRPVQESGRSSQPAPSADQYDPFADQ